MDYAFFRKATNWVILKRDGQGTVTEFDELPSLDAAIQTLELRTDITVSLLKVSTQDDFRFVKAPEDIPHS